MASAEREYPLSAKRNCSRRPRRPRGPRGSRQKTLYEADNRPVPAVIVEPVPVIPGTIFNVFGYSLSAFGGCGCTTSCVMSYLGYGPAAPCLHGTRTDSATNTEDSESDTADSDSLVEIEDTTISPSPNKYLFTPPAPPTSRLQGRRGRRYRHVPHTPDIFRELKGIKAIGQRGPTPNIPTSPGATTAPVCNNSKPPALNTSNDNSSRRVQLLPGVSSAPVSVVHVAPSVHPEWAHPLNI
ncbi:uncharacterized protein LOC112572600 [Pomacea canaliculata]|nr:uncharacterized protein LOC112572600 [Pomacea canaliculata]